jgi:soluble P-type ATPase
MSDITAEENQVSRTKLLPQLRNGANMCMDVGKGNNDHLPGF